MRLARRWGVPSIQFALERLKQKGFLPTAVFDVGAYEGDFAALCLELWPGTMVTCFEVLPEPSQKIINMSKTQDRLRLIPCLLGAENQQQVVFNIADTASSVLDERTHLKMDVQGYELAVLKGASRTLPSIQVILAEVNFLDIHVNVPLLADLVSWLSQRGWAAYDICGLIRRPLDQALWQADMIFVQSNSRFRQDKRYA